MPWTNKPLRGLDRHDDFSVAAKSQTLHAALRDAATCTDLHSRPAYSTSFKSRGGMEGAADSFHALCRMLRVVTRTTQQVRASTDTGVRAEHIGVKETFAIKCITPPRLRQIHLASAASISPFTQSATTKPPVQPVCVLISPCCTCRPVRSMCPPLAYSHWLLRLCLLTGTTSR